MGNEIKILSLTKGFVSKIFGKFLVEEDHFQSFIRREEYLLG